MCMSRAEAQNEIQWPNQLLIKFRVYQVLGIKRRW